ncbi:hypothetical protein PUG81_17045 [Erwiniaceae bacterium L1_54_6]|nr:hypothetical protein [Erwiniaceae bacterium L1_54_6]
MNMDFFRNELAPLLSRYEIKYSNFSNGALGDLERVEFEGEGKVGTIDFWSSDWLGIDVFDLNLNDQTINVLLNPEEEVKKKETMEMLKMILVSRE